MPAVRSELIEVYVFRQRNQCREYLLLKRSAEETLYPNLWQIVTGTLQENEQALAGALRELQEETQLRALRVWNVPIVNSFYDARNDVVQMVPLFAVEVQSLEEPVLSAEHQQYQWLNYDEAMKLLAWPTQRWGLKVIDEFIGTHEDASILSEIHTHYQRKEKQ